MFVKQGALSVTRARAGVIIEGCRAINMRTREALRPKEVHGNGVERMAQPILEGGGSLQV